MKGSREPFHARMVPYFDSTDHHAFTPRHVGVPATSLTNWPDEFIHSTGDDLENIDATQLERNAVVTAAVALYFAALGDDELPALAGYVAARGRARVAADGATADRAPRSRGTAGAAGRLSRGAGTCCASPWRRSRRRSRRCGAWPGAAARASSCRRRRAGSRACSRPSSTRSSGLYGALTGQNLPNIELSPDERAMADKVYVPLPTRPPSRTRSRRWVRTGALHPMMRFEALNFADGRRSAFEVYEAVAAEALSAGEWYYGQVTPADGAGGARLRRDSRGLHGPEAMRAGVPYHVTCGGVSMRTMLDGRCGRSWP